MVLLSNHELQTIEVAEVALEISRNAYARILDNPQDCPGPIKVFAGQIVSTF